MAFVGTKKLNSLEELQKFLEEIQQEQNYYFVRSPHKVSGIRLELTAESKAEINSATEGQVFNSQWELRWKKKGTGYELLLLSKENNDLCTQFEPIPFEWQIEDRKALLYEANDEKSDREVRSKETRFPQGFTHNQPKICERYFLNSQTATVHFVALTVAN